MPNPRNRPRCDQRWGSNRGVYYWYDRPQEKVWYVGGTSGLRSRIHKYLCHRSSKHSVPCEDSLVRVGLVIIANEDNVFWWLEAALISILTPPNQTAYYQDQRDKWVERLGIDKLRNGTIVRVHEPRREVRKAS